MGLLKEFKDFAMRGNVVDLAVGVIMGAAFGKIVNSLVNDIIMPPIGAPISQGKFNFKDQFLDLRTIDPLLKEPVQAVKSLDEAQKLGVPVLAYGSFLTSIIDFTIMAFCIFLMVKLMTYLMKRQEEAPKPVPEDVELLREIRDLLKADKAS